MPAIFQADVYCGDCADAIRADLTAPADLSNESTWDSDDYPKYMGPHEETDTPQHCACGFACVNAIELQDGRRVGALVSDRLTTDGVAYVRQAIAEGGAVAELWAEHFKSYL